MLRLQNVKMDLSDAALNEGTNGMRLTKMSVRELKTVRKVEPGVGVPLTYSF